MSFIVLMVVGPYRSFKRVEGDAKAWTGVNGQTASVEPLVAPAKA